MLKIPIVKKKLGNIHLVWFQNSNSFIQFEEPAWYVFSKFKLGLNEADIAQKFSIRYKNQLEDSFRFVNEICKNIALLNQNSDLQSIESDNFRKKTGHHFNSDISHCYKLGEKLILFSFENAYFEKFIHPLISHLETKRLDIYQFEIELFSLHQKIVLRVNGNVIGVWQKTETHLVKGKIFMVLINCLYNKSEKDWLMTVHASAITNGEKTILFSAPPGNGKTTIGALLQTVGFKLISDDFVPIDRRNFYAFPVPFAMSVKTGSTQVLLPHFPELEERDLTYISPEKSVRYLSPVMYTDLQSEVHPVRNFIFVKYDKSVDLVFEKVDQIMGLKELLQETWVLAKRENVKILFAKLDEISFYQLTYSNNQKAINAIKNLFEND